MREKFDPNVFELGYVALETADIERTKNHYLETIGMTQTAKGDDGSVFLSIGYNHHNIVLRPAKQKALWRTIVPGGSSYPWRSACSLKKTTYTIIIYFQAKNA